MFKALKCCPTSHHVDSFFVEGVLVCVFWVMHQNFGLEGPMEGALLETLTWKSNREGFCVTTDYFFLTSNGAESDLNREGGHRSMTAALSNADRTSSSAADRRSFLVGSEDSAAVMRRNEPGEGYITQLISIKTKQLLSDTLLQKVHVHHLKVKKKRRREFAILRRELICFI